mgnify:CR=1 FL=1
MTEQDAELEKQITRAYMQMIAARTPYQRAKALGRMESLIGQRSPERIEEMERERGVK